LAVLAFNPGGVSVNQALRQADTALEPLREASLAAIDASIAEIVVRFGVAAPGRAEEPFEDLYVLCSGIIDLGIFVVGSGLDDAARYFCGLVDLSDELNIRAWDAIDVHIEALKLLRASGVAMTVAQRTVILDGLGKVTLRRVGDPRELFDRPAADN